MTSRAIFSKCLPHTQNLSAGSGQGKPECTREDVLLASQGISPELSAYIDYTIFNNPRASHGVYAGLFDECFRVQEITRFMAKSKNKIDRLCVVAVAEMSPNVKSLTAAHRARLFGTSRRTWFRRYKRIYQRILSMPHYWEENEMRRVGERLE